MLVAYILYGLAVYLFMGYTIVHFNLCLAEEIIDNMRKNPVLTGRVNKDLETLNISFETLTRIIFVVWWPITILVWWRK